ncbi:ATP-binding protein [Amycolatopsis magusensis]|uniref:ATP-binding protein n=1 Tax=Amycolatopsis magusensis TaxID=882444 RepID=UPI0024A98DDD|nr:tetratricopeptide repeat protein [Amycolatopsis magusensis]MDI5980669.1 tetratricopeptide repeat protein [Amycolatopsis magusensis]
MGVLGESFGALLRRLRERAFLTQEQLAQRAGVSAKAISALEREERRYPYPHTVLALANALGLSDGERACLEACVPRRVRRSTKSSDPERGTHAPGKPAPIVPGQLPSPVRAFTGRVAELTALDAVFDSMDEPGSTTAPAGRAVVISAISGTAGVGKTTLAVMWAHHVRAKFPDGQLYVNLRGYDPGPPATPGEVLDGFLRALDVPAANIPPSLDDRAALFRSVVTGRCLLIVLDNANSVAQIRPLLPGSSSCMVVVTSRDKLTGLAVSVGMHRISIDRLPEADAVALLRTIVGPDRADAEPAAVAHLARLCDRLPLAIQIAAQRAVTRPHLALGELAAELADADRRLEVFSLSADQFTAIRPVLSWSYRHLPEAQARLLRLLGLHPGPDIGTDAAAATAGLAPAVARQLLDGLVEAHLIEAAEVDRVQLHDLLRAYARECAEVTDTVEERREALHRLVGWYLHATAAADRQLHPGRQRGVVDASPIPEYPAVFGDFDAALEWCETERANLVAVARVAAETGLGAAAWQLANNLWSFFYLRKYWTDWVAVHETGLAAARELRDPKGQARMLNGLATAYVGMRRFDESLDHFRAAREFFRAAGDRWGEGMVLANLADTHLGLCRYPDAAGYARQAVEVIRETGNQYSEGIAMGNLGEAYLGMGAHYDALCQFRRVLELCRAIGHRHGEAVTLIHLGESHLGLGEYEKALDRLSEGLDLARQLRDRHSEALALSTRGIVYHQIGQPDASRQNWQAALDIYEDLGDPRAEALRDQLRQPRTRSG